MSRGAPIALVLSTLAAIALAGVYIAGGQPQAEGALLAVSLGGIGIAMGLWGRELGSGHADVDERPPLRSARRSRDEFTESLERGESELGRRSLVVRLFVLAGGALGAAALFPLRSLGPTPGDALRRTAWRAGSRAVVG